MKESSALTPYPVLGEFVCRLDLKCFSLLSFRNPSYFSTPSTRTDMYPSIGNMSISSARQEDHTSFLPFSTGRPVELNPATTSRPGDAYSPYSAGMSVTKSSPPKVSVA